MNTTAYIIKNIRTVTLNGVFKIAFDAYKEQDHSHVFCGSFTAPARTAKRDLYKFIAE